MGSKELPDHLGDRITARSAHVSVLRPLSTKGFLGDVFSFQFINNAGQQSGQVIFQFLIGKLYTLLRKT